MTRTLHIFFALFLALTFSSCSTQLADNDPSSSDAISLRIKVSRSIDNYSGEGMYPMNAPIRKISISDYCTRIQCAIFSGSTKVKILNQTSDDASFGTLDLALNPGTYTIVLLAHNGLGNATISTPDRVTFASNKVTDTFVLCDTLTLTSSAEMNAVLHRCVGAFQLALKDTIPSDVTRFRFYYTGGSSTLNASTGFGCVDSRQTEYLTVTPNNQTFTIYTFPHDTIGLLNINVQALDASDNIIRQKDYNGYLIQPNWITRHEDYFFISAPMTPDTPTDSTSTTPTNQSLSLSLLNNAQWSGPSNSKPYA